MKIDLHCNLPYYPMIPNPVLGYLKGFLSSENNINVRNIYWNIFPVHLQNRYIDLNERISQFFPFRNDFSVVMHIARYLYHKNPKQLPRSLLTPIFESPFFFDNEVEELSQDLKNHIANYVEQKELFDVDVAGFTLKTYQWILNYYVLLQLKKHNPSIKTIIGGISSLSQGLEFMRVFKKADFAIWGEGEIPLIKLLQHIEDPSKFNEIPNLIYRKKDEIISTYQIAPENLPDINQYPFADHTDYFNTLKEHQLDNYRSIVRIPIWGFRSCCWNKCKFCILNDKGIPYRERSPENIVAEIEYQSQKHDIDSFIFVDNDIGRADRGSFDKFLDLLVQSSEHRARPYRITADISPLRLDRKSIEVMNKIVFDSVQIGFEAMTDALLRKMMKKHSFAYNIQALKLAEEQDFSVKGLNIIRGIPSENEEDVLESINNLKFLRFLLHKYNLYPSRLHLYKCAPFFTEVSEQEREEWWNYSYLWSEIEGLDLLSSVDKREFFGFFRKGLEYSFLWDLFDWSLKQYQSKRFQYNWFEYSDRSSLIEAGEKGYALDPIETEILTFCDTVKTFSEIKSHFPRLETRELQKILLPLKKTGLLYFNDNFKYFFISIVSTKYKKKF